MLIGVGCHPSLDRDDSGDAVDDTPDSGWLAPCEGLGLLDG